MIVEPIEGVRVLSPDIFAATYEEVINEDLQSP